MVGFRVNRDWLGLFNRSIPSQDNPIAVKKSGFTLIELLIVITLIVILGGLVIASFDRNVSRGIDHGSRILQAGISRARSKAIQRSAAVGLYLDDPGPEKSSILQEVVASSERISSEDDDRNVLFLVELRRLDEAAPQGDFDADSPEVVLVAAIVDHKWESWERVGRFNRRAVRVRIPSGDDGVWYNLRPVSGNSSRLVESDGPWSVIRVQTPLIDTNLLPFPLVVAGSVNSGASSLDLEFTTEPAPFSEPVVLPEGVVIDLNWSSPSVRTLMESTGGVELMFSPRGNLVGPAAALGPLHFLLTDRQDSEALDEVDAYDNTTGQRRPDGVPDVPRRRRSPIDPRNLHPKSIVTVIPQSGAVLTAPIDPTDLLDNVTGAPGPDGLADDLFRFARSPNGSP